MKNKLHKILVLSLVLISGFNFLPQFKLGPIPVFQILIVTSLLTSFYNINKNTKNTNVTRCYLLYILTSLPSLFIGLFLEISNVFLVFIYTLFPLLLFLTTYIKISKLFYLKLLWGLNISMILIVVVGWLLRFSFISSTFFFDVIPSEFKLGYWGIQYTESTRNHDYLYPLVGLSVSVFFYTLNKYKLVCLGLVVFFIITLLASNSRGAIVVSVIAVFLLLKKSTAINKFVALLFFAIIVIINFNIISNLYTIRYESIISSIFRTKDQESRFSNGERLSILNDGFNAAVVNPIGYGFNNYSYIYESRPGARVSNSGENAFLTLLIERGWLALFFFLKTFWFLYKEATFKGGVSLNRYLTLFLFLYFMFNYELNSSFATFMFFIMFLDNNFICSIVFLT